MQIIEKINALPTSDKERALKLLLQESYKGSLYLTAKRLLGYQDINWYTHGDTIEALEANTKRKLIVMPRGTFKSSISSVSYPIWCLIRNPNERILIDSEVYTNSKNFLREISQHLMSPKVTELFGDFRGSTWNEGEIIIAQRTKVLKEASITASGVGAIKVGQHYDRIIMDDLNSNNNSNTVESREKVIQHYRYNTAILEPDGVISVIATRYAANDLPGFVLQNEMGITR